MYYYMLLSKNKVEMNDNMIAGKTKFADFVETRIDYNVEQELESTDSYNNAYIAFYI